MNLFGIIFFGILISCIIYYYFDIIKNYLLNNWVIVICILILFINFIINNCKKIK